MIKDHKYEGEFAVLIAKEAGVIMLEYFDADQGVEVKADNSLVTIADKKINSMVIERLSAKFPEDGIIGEEESNAEYGMGRKWICDPVDGTSGFIWGTPTAMFSLALVEDGKPVLGVAYDPFLDKLYTGVVGGPSMCNGMEIQVSNLDLQSGILAVSGSIKALIKNDMYQKIKDDHVRMAAFSGAVYKSCPIAKGKLVGHMEDGLNPHDVAAIHVIVEGAGGKITSLTGEELNYAKPFKGAIISNGVVHEKLIEYCR